VSGSGSLSSWHQGPLLAELGNLPVSAIDVRSSPPETPHRRTPGSPMPAPRAPRSGPLWDTRDAPRAVRPGDTVGQQRGRAGRQVFRIPDFQVPTHLALRRSERGRIGPGKLGI